MLRLSPHHFRIFNSRNTTSSSDALYTTSTYTVFTLIRATKVSQSTANFPSHTTSTRFPQWGLAKDNHLSRRWKTLGRTQIPTSSIIAMLLPGQLSFLPAMEPINLPARHAWEDCLRPVVVETLNLSQKNKSFCLLCLHWRLGKLPVSRELLRINTFSSSRSYDSITSVEIVRWMLRPAHTPLLSSLVEGVRTSIRNRML